MASPGIADLPDNVLTHMAAYLPMTYRALFAAALTVPSSSWRNCAHDPQTSATRKAIVSPEERRNTKYSCYQIVLDFAELDTNLGSELTDDDLGAILVVMDAKNKLHRLKLAGCTSIKGHGLEPLRGSEVLEQIDLSLVGKGESPWLYPDPKLCEDAVLPILSSIVNAESSSLAQLQLPTKWTIDMPRVSPALRKFLSDYNQHLRGFSFWCGGGIHYGDCRGCNDRDDDWVDPWSPHREWIDSTGGQKFTCFECLENVCEDTDHEFPVDRCSTCERYSCGDCSQIKKCGDCETKICDHCDGITFEEEEERTCEECDAFHCPKCFMSCGRCGQLICKNRNCMQFSVCTTCEVEVDI